MITLVLGGASSGKSSIAEGLVSNLDLPITYVATGVATDDDMAARIRVHQQRRPATWKLIEATGPELMDVLRDIEGSVLLDALGTWVASYELFDGAEVTRLCEVLANRNGDTVVVTEEVGMGVHPSYEAGRRFRDDLGRLNTAVSGIATDVLLVIAGRILPLERLT